MKKDSAHLVNSTHVLYDTTQERNDYLSSSRHFNGSRKLSSLLKIIIGNLHYILTRTIYHAYDAFHYIK